MTYAVIATYKLPDTMGSAVIAVVCLGRFNSYENATDIVADHSAWHPDLVTSILELLENDLDMWGLQITYHVRYEGK